MMDLTMDLVTVKTTFTAAHLTTGGRIATVETTQATTFLVQVAQVKTLLEGRMEMADMDHQEVEVMEVMVEMADMDHQEVEVMEVMVEMADMVTTVADVGDPGHQHDD